MSKIMVRGMRGSSGVLLSSDRDYQVDFVCCGCGHKWGRVAKQIKFEDCPKCGGNVLDVDGEVINEQ